MQSSPTIRPTPRPFSERWSTFQRQFAPYLFVAPFFILFLVFGLFPTLFSLFISFQRWAPANGLESMKFVGWENYAFVLTDTWFWKSIFNTLWLAVWSGIPQHLIALPLAFAIHMGLKKLQTFVSAVYFLPYITSTVAVSLIFWTFFSQNYGLINQLLTWAHTLPLIGGLFPAEPINWLDRPDTVKPAIAAVVVWRYVGWNTVLYLTGLQAIPNDVYEAAKMDGASTWQTFTRITLPLLRPILFFAVTLTIIGNMQLFDEAFVLTAGRGGTDQAGLTTAMYLYREGFDYQEMGNAAATSWLLFILIGLLTLVNNLFFKNGKEEE